MVLAKALVDLEKEMKTTYDDQKGHILPQIPLHKARQVKPPMPELSRPDTNPQQIMTRADFDRQYDHTNLFTITSNALMRADSVPMQHAFRAICAEPGFDKYLEDTLQRIADIESLGRTRELVAKDLVLGAKYKISAAEGGWTGRKSFEVEIVPAPEEDDDDEKKD
jgi:hypothetical protein